MKLLCVIQARLGSQRFPRKVLERIGPQSMLTHVSKRVSTIAGVWATRVAWPEDAPCDENDVLGRFAHVAAEYSCDTILRVTADCPLLAPDLAEQVIGLYREMQPYCEYAWNVAPGYVDGTDVEVFSRHALEWAQREATEPEDREHVTPWIRRHCKTATHLPDADYSRHKWSVDTRDDLERVRAIVARLPPHEYDFKTTLRVADERLARGRFEDFGAGTPVMLHGTKRVMNV